MTKFRMMVSPTKALAPSDRRAPCWQGACQRNSYRLDGSSTIEVTIVTGDVGYGGRSSQHRATAGACVARERPTRPHRGDVDARVRHHVRPADRPGSRWAR